MKYVPGVAKTASEMTSIESGWRSGGKYTGSSKRNSLNPMQNLRNKLLVAAALLAVGGGSYALGSYNITRSAAHESGSHPPGQYADAVSKQCPDDTNVSDRYVCIYDLASVTIAQADALVQKLIAEAPVRLKEVSGSSSGPMSWEYGGELFLKDLPAAVLAAQNARDGYFDAVCRLDEMTLYGGSGADLEREACRYHYAKQYLAALQQLADGVNR